MYSKLTIKTRTTSGTSIVNFELISHFILMLIVHCTLNQFSKSAYIFPFTFTFSIYNSIYFLSYAYPRNMKYLFTNIQKQ